MGLSAGEEYPRIIESMCSSPAQPSQAPAHPQRYPQTRAQTIKICLFIPNCSRNRGLFVFNGTSLPLSGFSFITAVGSTGWGVKMLHDTMWLKVASWSLRLSLMLMCGMKLGSVASRLWNFGRSFERRCLEVECAQYRHFPSFLCKSRDVSERVSQSAQCDDASDVHTEHCTFLNGITSFLKKKNTYIFLLFLLFFFFFFFKD